MIIYKITNLINNKVYIGQTHNFNKRKREHLYKAKIKYDSNLYNDMNKYGIDNFTFEIIDNSAKNQDDLDYLETFYIVKYNSVREGYNITYGGKSQPMDIPEVYIKHNNKMRSAEVRNKISNTMKKNIAEGKFFTAEHRKNLSKAAMGNHNFGDDHATRCIPCYCIDKITGLRHDFKSYKDGGLWWYKTYKPFGDNYSQITYQRKIIQSIKLGKSFYNYFDNGKKQKIVDDVVWFLSE